MSKECRRDNLMKPSSTKSPFRDSILIGGVWIPEAGVIVSPPPEGMLEPYWCPDCKKWVENADTKGSTEA